METKRLFSNHLSFYMKPCVRYKRKDPVSSVCMHATLLHRARVGIIEYYKERFVLVLIVVRAMIIIN